jgi:hypothetical protein
MATRPRLTSGGENPYGPLAAATQGPHGPKSDKHGAVAAATALLWEVAAV